MKVIALVLLWAVLTFVSALVGTLFLYFGWNYGIVPASTGRLAELGLLQTFCLSLGLSTIASILKGAKVETKD